MKSFKYIVGSTMALALGADAAVRTVELRGELAGSAGKQSLFTVTFEDGDDASIAGAVDVTLKAAAGVDWGTVGASGWWLNFDSPARIAVSDLGLSYRVLGEFGLSSYRLVEESVPGPGVGYGDFDIGVTFDDVRGTFSAGDRLELVFQAAGATLSNSDFFQLEPSTAGGYEPVYSAVRLNQGTILGAGVPPLAIASSEPGSGLVTVSTGIGDNDQQCRDLEAQYAAYQNDPSSPAAGPFQNLSALDAQNLFNQLYFQEANCPEPSTVMVGVGVLMAGVGGWWQRRRMARRG